MKVTLPILVLSWAVLGCVSSPAMDRADEINAVSATIDDFHRAASEADEDRYFRHLAAGSVFLGTDATERWTTDQFREYAHPHFSKGRGWTFTPRHRNVTLARSGDVAWFDESLDSASYGECRGTGVLQKVAGRWVIEQYNLTIPIPNDLAGELVARIREKPPKPVERER